jgi:DNA-binding response OmpR family regulator
MNIYDIKILIVNEKVGIGKIFSRYLEQAGFNCKTALSGKEALEILKDEKYDLIITNYYMPRMNGLELTLYINEFIKPKPLIIFETSECGEDVHQISSEAGADGCYTHIGIERDALLSSVFALLRRRNYLDMYS